MVSDLTNHSEQVIDSTGTKDTSVDTINTLAPRIEETVGVGLGVFDRVYIPDEFGLLFPVDDDFKGDTTFNVFD